MKRLDQLAVGEAGVVTGFVGGDPRIETRLLEMGFDEGVEVKVTDAAAGGDPLAVRVGPTKVALRRALAGRIAVR